METFIRPDNAWLLLAAITAGAALSIYLEQTHRWAGRVSGPVLALLGGMLLSNSKLLPTSAPLYDLVDDYLVPVAIPLLLFRANVVRIVRETGSMFRAFHVATLGTIVGAFLAAFTFRAAFERVPEVSGIMTGSYIGGGVNFVAIKNTYQVSSELANPLLVADNFIMAGMFALLFVIAGSRFFRRHYPHPHSLEAAAHGDQPLAARHWQRKDIALLDIAAAFAVAVAVTAVSIKFAEFLKGQVDSKLVESMIGNPFVWITLLTAALATAGHRWTESIHGAEELGVFLLYLFFFVIGLRADLWQVLRHVPVLFLFCLVIALTNLIVTLVLGRIFRLELEELLLSVNATLGGPPTAAAMAIACGWTRLVLPGLLAGIWGYVIGTFLGIAVAEALLRIL